MPLAIRLPLPPSVNSYWQRNFTGGMRIGKPGVRYRDEVILAVRERCSGVKRTTKAIAIEIRVTNSERFPADLDNLRKALYDSLCHAGLFWDDCQVVRDSGVIEAVSGKGWLDVRIIGIGEFDSLPEYARKRVMKAIQDHDLGPKKRVSKPKAVAARKFRR